MIPVRRREISVRRDIQVRREVSVTYLLGGGR